MASEILFAEIAFELEATRLAVEEGLKDVTRRAYGLAGGKDPLAVYTGKVDDRLEW